MNMMTIPLTSIALILCLMTSRACAMDCDLSNGDSSSSSEPIVLTEDYITNKMSPEQRNTLFQKRVERFDPTYIGLLIRLGAHFVLDAEHATTKTIRREEGDDTITSVTLPHVWVLSNFISSSTSEENILKVVEAFLKAGVSPNLPSGISSCKGLWSYCDGNPLKVAGKYKLQRVVQLLIEYGGKEQ